MMRQEQRVHAWSATSVGMVREGNEDSLFHGTTAFAVADGMGGHQAGEVASATALEPIAKLDGIQFPTPDEAKAALTEAVIAANDSVFEKAAAAVELRGMGTTLTAVLVRDGRFHLAHVGDSRAYLLRSGEPISQLTTDHTLVQQLIDEGRLSSDEADTHPQRSVITRAIGVDRSVEVETLPPLEMLPGDQILICSDGLTGPVKEEEITGILSHLSDGAEACQALIDAANAAGGPDNITVVLLRVEGGLPEDVAARSQARSGDTQDLGSPGAPVAASASAGPVTQIRTRTQETEEFDARKFGHYGGPQGAELPARTLASRSRRIIVAALGALLVLGLVVAGAYAVVSRAYFVGNDDLGTIAIFQGLRQQIGRFPLNRIVERTSVRMSDLPGSWQAGLREGIPMEDVAAAERYIHETLMPRALQTQHEAEAARQRASQPLAPPIPPAPPATTPGTPDAPGPAPVT
ncbi:MAG: Stp1/IreP family PP2C-type Ser/Thr phosphatase [Egibacteraceae bacterium]